MRRLICLAFLCCIPLFAAAQDKPVSLVADRVSIRSGDVLIAEGNVEVFHEGNHLRATKIVYDPGRDLLDIQGPMILISGERTILLAENAELDPALTAGILRSARLLLDQQMQIAAAQIHRVDDRYIVLDKTVASSCQVCSEAEVPLWQIRASRIVHDQKRRQIFFDNARFEIAGVPVLYLPTLRLPDPTLKRATGFLSPSLRVTDSLGTGIKIPYFIAFGDHLGWISAVQRCQKRLRLAPGNEAINRAAMRVRIIRVVEVIPVFRCVIVLELKVTETRPTHFQIQRARNSEDRIAKLLGAEFAAIRAPEKRVSAVDCRHLWILV